MDDAIGTRNVLVCSVILMRVTCADVQSSTMIIVLTLGQGLAPKERNRSKAAFSTCVS
jgi:hypothetical protein